jgi:hypothetical protein
MDKSIVIYKCNRILCSHKNKGSGDVSGGPEKHYAQ